MVEAFYFDGNTATRRHVRLSIAEGKLHIRGTDVARQLALDSLTIGEPLANAPRHIELPDGGRCEVPDAAALARMLSAAGICESSVVRLQKRWSWALASFLFVLVWGFCTYRWGLPEAARFLAHKVPPELSQKISHGVLRQLDDRYFKPSRLPEARQQQIREQATAVLGALETPPWRLHFRTSTSLGSNAFALPDGSIILLDPLVSQLDDAELNAVIAHEIGHLVHRDALRLLIQNATVAFIVAAWLGDASSAAVGISSQLLQTDYSREAELEADAFAARFLLRCCRSAEPLISSLGKLERAHGQSGGAFATHPDTRHRITAIRAMQP